MGFFAVGDVSRGNVPSYEERGETDVFAGYGLLGTKVYRLRNESVDYSNLSPKAADSCFFNFIIARFCIPVETSTLSADNSGCLIDDDRNRKKVY